jgi:putative FmdB family regulatory protein
MPPMNVPLATVVHRSYTLRTDPYGCRGCAHMPIYEYTCGACHAQFEELVRMGARDSSVTCPHCGEKRATRKVSVVAAGQSRTDRADAPPNLCGHCGQAGACPAADF